MLVEVPAIPEPFDVDEFIKWEIPESQNAFSDYRQAGELMEQLLKTGLTAGEAKVDEPPDFQVIIDKGWPDAGTTVKDWLELNRAALLIWRKGTEKSQGRFVSPGELSIRTNLESVQKLRQFARLAIYEELRLLEAGQFDEAWSWGRAAFRSGGHASRQACIVQALTATAIHFISTDGLARWAEHPQLTSEQIRVALKESQADYTLYESRGNILRAEYMAMQNTLMSSDWPQLIAFNTGGKPTAMSTPVRLGYWVIGEPDRASRLFRQIMANQLPEIDKSPSQRRKLVGSGKAMLFDRDPAAPLSPGQLDAFEIDRNLSRTRLFLTLAPARTLFDRILVRQETRQNAFLILLAAQAYRRDHGEFPESLECLVPNYLDAIPLDPSNLAGKSLRYRRDNPTSAVVWGLGEDNSDDGGQVRTDSGRPIDVGFELK